MPQDFFRDEVEFALDIHIGNLAHAHATQRENVRFNKRGDQKIALTVEEDIQWACNEMREHFDLTVGFVIGWLSRLVTAEDMKDLSNDREHFLRQRRNIDLHPNSNTLINDAIEQNSGLIAQRVQENIPDIVDHCERIVSTKTKKPTNR